MADDLDSLLRDELRARAAEGLLRELPGESATTPRRGDFRSNDYLGLAGDARVVAAAQAAAAEFGAGGRAARLLGGGSPLAARAERDVAHWLGAERALLFPSGFQANLGLLGALAGRGDALFSDQLNHASLVDGARLARAQVQRYRHRDLDELARRLALARGARRRIVVSETIFSMDGDRAPLEELHELCERFDAWLVLDEAHAIGLLGPRGAGAWAATGRCGGDARRLAARVVTGGKALGAAGAFVVGSAPLRDALLQRARAFVFTTAPPPAVDGALVAAIEACQRADEARARALSLAVRVAARLDLPPPAAAIVPVAAGDAASAVRIGDELAQAGLAVGAVRPPTVPQDGARLRLVAHAFNDEEGADALAGKLARLGLPRPIAAPAAARASATARPIAAWFVVGTDTGVGKTIVSALLLRAARALGPAAYWKPVQTGSDDDTATVKALSQARDGELVPVLHRFALPASPHEAARAEGASIDPAALAARLDGLRRQPAPWSRLIVELAGGLLVPYRSGAAPFVQADWLATAGARLVLVARAGLGTLNHTLLTLEALRARHLEPDALFLVGDAHAGNAATLRELGGVGRVVEVGRFAPLEPAALAAWNAGRGLDELLELPP